MAKVKLTRAKMLPAGDFAALWCEICDEEIGFCHPEPYADFGDRILCVYCASRVVRVSFHADDSDPNLLRNDTVETLLADGLRSHTLKEHS